MAGRNDNRGCSMHVSREYDFPNARIRVYRNRTCREFPKWCPMISVERSRGYVAEALQELRRYRRIKPG